MRVSGTPYSYFGSLLRRHGTVRTVLVLTLISIALSVGITLLVNTVLGADMEEGWIIATVAPAIITPLLALPFLRLVGQLDRAETRLRRISSLDELTGAYSRRYAIEVGEAELRRARRSGEPVSIAVMDLDKFKRINDRHGHQAGDMVLSELARACKASLRGNDTVARYGGDEFMLVFPRADRESAKVLAQRILRAVSRLRLKHGDVALRPRVSIGTATSGAGVRTLDDLLSQADAALYRAKRSGGRRFAQAPERHG